MATKLTHVFKELGYIELKADIYLRSQDAHRRELNRSQVVVLFFHGGGFVASDREEIPPHIVQFCLMRGWILVSTDYRKLPQITGLEIWDDARDAYIFVKEKLPGILTGRADGARFDNVIVAGRSAGAYLAYLCGLNMAPKPLALLTYYGMTSMSDPFFWSNVQMGPNPVGWMRVKPFYSEKLTLGSTLPSKRFDPDCLLPDLSRNPAWEQPEPEPDPHPRLSLVSWFLQENQYPEMMFDVDIDLGDISWTELPKTVLIHGDMDWTIPFECSMRLVQAVGLPRAELFTAVDQGHAFDEPFFHGNAELSIVEEAWSTLDGVVKSSLERGSRSLGWNSWDDLNDDNDWSDFEF